VSDVNSTLPDDEALAAFANSALGTNRRRRRKQAESAGSSPDTDGSQTPAAEGAPPADEASAPVSEAAVEEEPTPSAEPLVEVEPEQESAPAPVAEEEPDRDAVAAQRFLSALDDPEVFTSPMRLRATWKEVEEAGLLGYWVPARDMTFGGILNEHMARHLEEQQRAAGEEKATVPGPTASPDITAADTTAVEETAEEPVVEEQQPSAATAEVEVRAVTVPVTPTPLPPALQGGGVIEVRVPDLGPGGRRGTQCTVMVSNNVRDRFARYQLEKKMAGEAEPSNAMVVRRAFLNAKRNNLFGEIFRDMYHRVTAVDEEDYDEDGLLGEVVGRRTVRGRVRDSGQQSFRPSMQELATYDAFSTGYGFPDRSAFIEGLLDKFLPQLPAPGRRR
jgi:hypothetical protein